MRLILILAVAISVHSLFAQTTRLNFGVGVGGILEEEYSAGRGQFYFGGQMPIKERSSIGIELSAGGNLLPVDGTSSFDGDTEILSGYSSRSLMALTKGKYEVEKTFGYPFFAVGAGLATTKMYVHAIDTKEVTKHNFVGLAEIGVAFENGLTTSFKYISERKSPFFSGQDVNGGDILLEETGFSTLHLTLGYRFELFKK